jgi:hypothetical protein
LQVRPVRQDVMYRVAGEGMKVVKVELVEG